MKWKRAKQPLKSSHSAWPVGGAKIDPAMALFNAVTVMSTNPEASGGVAIGEDYRMSA